MRPLSVAFIFLFNFWNMVPDFRDIECDFRIMFACPQASNIFVGGGGNQLPAPPTGDGAGRIYDYCSLAQFGS